MFILPEPSPCFSLTNLSWSSFSVPVEVISILWFNDQDPSSGLAMMSPLPPSQPSPCARTRLRGFSPLKPTTSVWVGHYHIYFNGGNWNFKKFYNFPKISPVTTAKDNTPGQDLWHRRSWPAHIFVIFPKCLGNHLHFLKKAFKDELDNVGDVQFKNNNSL